MDITKKEFGQIDEVMVETIELQSELLSRAVRVDFYQPEKIDDKTKPDLLLVNDGQDLIKMDFESMLNSLYKEKKIRPLLIAGIHCGDDRKSEYGMSAGPDYQGWGVKAFAYEQFIIEELFPFIKNRFHHLEFDITAFAGFSLGGLSAFDIAWNHPEIFSYAAVFSGSLWWRNISKDDRNYNAWINRMMHYQVAQSEFRPGMKFFFECGEHDEEEDRNRNGVIDSIDDTIDLMRLLLQKGYKEGKDFFYLQLPDGRHDVASWKKALPVFLERLKVRSES